mgnify:FL=1
MNGMLSRRKEIPDDLACFLQQQKQRQARQETTMRSFPTSGDIDQDKIALDQKKKRHQHEVSTRSDEIIPIINIRIINMAM